MTIEYEYLEKKKMLANINPCPSETFSQHIALGKHIGQDPLYGRFVHRSIQSSTHTQNVLVNVIMCVHSSLSTNLVFTQ